MATKTTMVRIKLKAYDHKILDESAKLIVELLRSYPAPYRERGSYDPSFTSRKQGFS